MLSDYLIAPSLNALFLTGILLMIITMLFIFNINQFLKITNFQKITLLCVMTSAIGIHGMLHLGAEKQYNFNPYKWI
jgi:hypothetical protein